MNNSDVVMMMRVWGVYLMNVMRIWGFYLNELDLMSLNELRFNTG